MTKLKWIVSLLVIVTFANCNESCDDICAAPGLSELKLKLTINDENNEVEVVVFRGRIESQDTVLIDTVGENVVRYELEPDGYYSATARYRKGNTEIIVINGKDFSFKEDDCGCDEAQNYSLNLNLKN